MAATGARRRGRILALKALYESDTTDHPAALVLERLAAEGLTREPENPTDEGDPAAAPRPEPAEVTAFGRRLVAGVERHRDTIDALIAEVAPQFPVQDVAVIDRNILRLAIYEVLFDNETPVRAAVNEAVDLAKTFGAESAPRFVNGVLGTIAARATR